MYVRVELQDRRVCVYLALVDNATQFFNMYQLTFAPAVRVLINIQHCLL